jgi:hypothetical protein
LGFAIYKEPSNSSKGYMIFLSLPFGLRRYFIKAPWQFCVKHDFSDKFARD